jgi:ubiquinone biosynthesis protein UbiJ
MAGTAQEQPGRAEPASGGSAALGGFSLLRPPTAAAVNHLLKSASWARARLQPFAGKVVRFELAPFTVGYALLDAGQVADASASAAPDAIFTLTPGIALRMLGGDSAAWQKVTVGGDGALAREILYIAQNLKWDVEEDLSRVFGDVIAHRMVGAAGELRRWQRDSARNMSHAMAAYWTDENQLVAPKQEVERFVRDVDNLRDDVARLEKRIEQLLCERAGRST